MNGPRGFALVARFQYFYPGVPYRDASYRTSDHVIPVGLFWAYLAELPAHFALEGLEHMQDIALALGMCFAKKDAPISEPVRARMRAAYVDE